MVTYLQMRFTPDGATRGLETLQRALADTREFDGCVEVRVLVDADDPARIALREVWASREQEAAYQAWRATPEGAITGLADVLAEPPAPDHVEG